MGCAPSGSAQESSLNVAEEHQDLAQWLDGLLSSNEPDKLLSAYVEIEKNILNEESNSPASALSLSVARQQHLKELIHTASEKRDRNGGLVPQENSFHELFVDLGLNRGTGVAAEHEEFLANVNRRALNMHLLEILARKNAAVEEAIRTASLSINKLQILYEKQDLLLGRIYGHGFGSEKERMLEEEIDTMRNYRDAFSNGAFLWREAAKDVQEAAELLTKGVAAWKSVQMEQSMERKIQTASEARNCIQEAVLLVELSQESMPGVQFPYCTKRELTSISQAVEYIFTDILIEDRYRHALQVYKNFQERAAALWRWITQVLNSTLGKDLTDIDRSILEVSKNLRNERINIICDKLGIENRYSLFGLNPAVNNIRPVISEMSDPNKADIKRKGVGLHTFGRMLEDTSLRSEFERNLAARRDTMWPSRRIEELRMMGFNVP
ncbi:UNVERIFIED_CONTAM: hypothetical protein PYX00_010563 [Menopon gallinae]|uniref:Uncharacterized protein n=1 Tax=Menopon gallinae TaxID=328185 RepID=A0AAW2HFV8_9NEOP